MNNKLNNIIDWIKKDFIIIVAMLFIFLLILALAYTAELEKENIKEEYEQQLKDCGCIEYEPYKVEPNYLRGDTYGNQDKDKNT